MGAYFIVIFGLFSFALCASIYNLLYLSGVPHTKVPSADIIKKIVSLVEDKVKEKNN